MRYRARTAAPENGAAARRFYSIAEAAHMFGMSEMTLYRAIHAGEFPAIRIRGRLIIPAKAIEAMADAALSGQRVDAADWAESGGAA
ncbi:MAG: helix-turn-helix domain-containing protein [Streptomycetales bacterium]